jgi:hypothetical protein
MLLRLSLLTRVSVVVSGSLGSVFMSWVFLLIFSILFYILGLLVPLQTRLVLASCVSMEILIGEPNYLLDIANLGAMCLKDRSVI